MGIFLSHEDNAGFSGYMEQMRIVQRQMKPATQENQNGEVYIPDRLREERLYVDCKLSQ